MWPNKAKTQDKIVLTISGISIVMPFDTPPEIARKITEAVQAVMESGVQPKNGG